MGWFLPPMMATVFGVLPLFNSANRADNFAASLKFCVFSSRLGLGKSFITNGNLVEVDRTPPADRTPHPEQLAKNATKIASFNIFFIRVSIRRHVKTI